MHHALLISEVTREICSALDEPSLPVLARTCRALEDPALDELWRDLYSIYPFVHLLTLSRTEDVQQCLSSHQWATLRRYSARTRSLYMCMIDESPYSDRFECLANPPDPGSFFPHLRAIAWYPDNHLAMLPFFRLLCGPALNTLSAEFASDPASLAVVAALGMTCPNLTEVVLSASSEVLSDSLTEALSTSIRHWHNLRHVSCDDFTVPAMAHLSRVKCLQSLTACATGRMSSFVQSLDPHATHFPTLERLHLYADFLSTATACLRGSHLALKDFWLDLFDFPGDAGSSTLHDLFAALAETCAHASLARLHLFVVHPHFSSPASTSALRDIAPLFRFSNLRVVHLEGISTLTLDDDNVVALARAWPAIEVLALATYVDHPVAALPTWRSLICLARSCPKLNALSLVVDTTRGIGPSSWVLGDAQVRSDALHDLRLGNSPISSPRGVARMLHRLYPALKQVDLSVWNKEPLNRLPRRDRYETCWGMVNIELRNQRDKDRC